MTSVAPFSIKSMTTTAPPGSPNTIDHYIVPAGATSFWIGSTNQITWYDSVTWQFALPYPNMEVLVLDTNVTWIWNGSSWVSKSASNPVPSYSVTIGDAAATSFTITHSLNVADYSVEVWELTGSKRNITAAVEIQNTSNTQATLIFNTIPALNAIRVDFYAISSAQGIVLQARTTATGTTASLGAGAQGAITVTLNRTTKILSIQTDYPAWVRMYNTMAALTADTFRAQNTDPIAGSGCVLDVATIAGALTIIQNPIEIFANFDTPTTQNAYISVTNNDVVSRAITVTVVHFPIEI